MMRTRWLVLFSLLALSVTATGQKYEEFIRKYKEAVELNDQKAVSKVIRLNPAEAIDWFKIQVDMFAQNGDNKAGDRAEALKKHWAAAFSGSTVLEKIARFREGLDPSEIRRINKLINQERGVWKLFEGAKESGKEREFRAALDGMRQIARALDEIGDKLEAARAWLYFVNIIEGFKGRTPDDVQEQVQAMDQYLQAHEDWGWTANKDYALNKAWARGLRERLKNPAKGAKKDDKGASSNAGILKYKPGSKWQTVALSHKIARRADEGLTAFASKSPLNWVTFGLTDKETKDLWFFKDGKILLNRTGPNKFLNPTSVGIKGKPFKPHGTKKPTELWYARTDKDGEIYDTNYAFFVFVGGRQEPWIDTSLNLSPTWQPTRKTAVFFMRSASYFVTAIEGQKVTLYDENCNGIFGDKVGSSAFGDFTLGGGIDKAVAHPVVDSMKIGRSKLLPFSSFVKLGEDWFALKVVRNNEEIRYRALDPELVKSGTVSLKWKGPSKTKPKHLVIREASGQYPGALFDLASAKAVEVPAGKYELFYGRIFNGKVPQNLDATILKGESKPFEVKPGEAKVVVMGAPFHLEFTPERSGQEIKVDASKFWVRDSSGAKIGRIQSAILEPNLVAAKDKKGKGSRVLGRWRRLEGLELNDVFENYSDKQVPGTAMAAIPIDGKTKRFSITVRSPYGNAGFISVQQKKHKLFGKLLPVWK